MTQVSQQADGALNLGSAEEQARQCMQNFATELEKVGSGLDRVLSITIYLTDLEDFGAVTGVWGEFYPGRGPGRTTVGVADLHPAGLRVEMTAFAVRDA